MFIVRCLDGCCMFVDFDRVLVLVLAAYLWVLFCLLVVVMVRLVCFCFFAVSFGDFICCYLLFALFGYAFSLTVFG